MYVFITTCMEQEITTLFLPYWSKDYLIQEIVVEVLGSCETHPFYCEGGDEAKEDADSTENAKSSHVERLGRTSMRR